MVLHTLSVTQGDPGVERCFRCLSADDTLLLLGAGAYLVTLPALEALPCRVCVLDTDLALSGLKGTVLNPVRVISMAEFVALSARAAKQVAWY